MKSVKNIKNNIFLTQITFLLALFCSFSAVGQVPDYVPVNGLVGWWPFNGNANDESGNGLNGINNSAQPSTDRNNIANQAFFFDGINSYISIGNSTKLNFQSNNSFSFSYWINASSLSSTQLSIILSKQIGSGSSQDGFNSNVEMIFSSNFRIMNGTSSPSFTLGTSSNSIKINTWYHIVNSYNGNQGFIYINGVLSSNAIGTAALGDNSASLQIGKATWVAGNVKHFHGKIDDIGIWNRALNECEIQQLYKASLDILNTEVTQNGNQLATVFIDADSYQWLNCDDSFKPINGETNSNISLTNNENVAVEITLGSCKDTSDCFNSPNCSVNASFKTNKTIFCDFERLVNFTNTSFNADYFIWKNNGTYFSSANDPAYFFDSIGTYTIQLIAGNSVCTDTFETIIQFVDTKLWKYSDRHECINETIQLNRLNGIEIKIYSFKSESFIETFYADTLGETKYIAIDELGCYLKDTFSVFVHPKPVSKINYSFTKNNYSFGGCCGKKYKWEPYALFGSNNVYNPEINIYTSNWVYLTVTDSNGCSALDSAFIEINPYIPNIITPNGDNVNDAFAVTGIIVSNIKIYNRWGKLVFESDNYANDWDATNNPDGMYYYSITATNEQFYKGWIQVTR